MQVPVACRIRNSTSGIILGVRYTNIPHVFWKFQQYTNIPHAWFGRAKRAYQYTSCFRKMAKYTNIPQFNEYQETITSPLLYRYLPYIICVQCMNNVIWIFLVSTWNCRVKLIEICDDWLERCGGGSVRVETKSRLHQQYIRVLWWLWFAR